MERAIFLIRCKFHDRLWKLQAKKRKGKLTKKESKELEFMERENISCQH